MADTISAEAHEREIERTRQQERLIVAIETLTDNLQTLTRRVEAHDNLVQRGKGVLWLAGLIWVGCAAVAGIVASHYWK